MTVYCVAVSCIVCVSGGIPQCYSDILGAGSFRTNAHTPLHLPSSYSFTLNYQNTVLLSFGVHHCTVICGRSLASWGPCLTGLLVQFPSWAPLVDFFPHSATLLTNFPPLLKYSTCPCVSSAGRLCWGVRPSCCHLFSSPQPSLHLRPWPYKHKSYNTVCWQQSSSCDKVRYTYSMEVTLWKMCKHLHNTLHKHCNNTIWWLHSGLRLLCQ